MQDKLALKIKPINSGGFLILSSAKGVANVEQHKAWWNSNETVKHSDSAAAIYLWREHKGFISIAYKYSPPLSQQMIYRNGSLNLESGH